MKVEELRKALKGLPDGAEVMGIAYTAGDDGWIRTDGSLVEDAGTDRQRRRGAGFWPN